MKLTCGLNLILLVLMLAVATKAHTVIQCYVCDDCAKVDKNTPVEQCGGEHTKMTTTSTSMPSTSQSNTSPSTEAPTTTPTTTPSTTTSTTTTTTTTARPTEIATPPTIGPIPSTTNLPTPPSLEESGSILDRLNQSFSIPNATLRTPPPTIFVTPSEEVLFNTTPESGELSDFPFGFGGNQTFNETIPSAVLVRQRRHTEFNGITYQCYKIQKKYGNVFGTKRGCIGIKAEESVCTKLDMENGNQTKKCSQCTTTKCNGSSTIGVSIAALLVALFAVIYRV